MLVTGLATHPRHMPLNGARIAYQMSTSIISTLMALAAVFVIE